MVRAVKQTWFRDNGLTLVLAALFLISFVGQFISGLSEENHDADPGVRGAAGGAADAVPRLSR
jgi:hypothetical protein